MRICNVSLFLRYYSPFWLLYVLRSLYYHIQRSWLTNTLQIINNLYPFIPSLPDLIHFQLLCVSLPPSRSLTFSFLSLVSFLHFSPSAPFHLHKSANPSFARTFIYFESSTRAPRAWHFSPHLTFTLPHHTSPNITTSPHITSPHVILPHLSLLYLSYHLISPHFTSP